MKRNILLAASPYVRPGVISHLHISQASVLHTIELEPTATGTTVHMRFAAPKAKREIPLMQQIGPAYAHALEVHAPELVTQLDAALAAREAGHEPEPELIGPKPDGLLAGMA